jgi:hypothetical protein
MTVFDGGRRGRGGRVTSKRATTRVPQGGKGRATWRKVQSDTFVDTKSTCSIQKGVGYPIFLRACVCGVFE